MIFKDRYDAAMQLVPLLEKYRKKAGVVLAVPRGGVPMGYYIATALHFPLDLLMTKKIGHPHNPEYAIGAVSLEGQLIDEQQGIEKDYFDYETNRLRKQMAERYKKFMGDKKPVDLKDKIVIVVDDGIATGYTIMAAVQLLRKKKPQKIVVAVPVAPPETAKKVENMVDDFICLHTPSPFYGVGRFYDDFSEVIDEDVMALLKELNQRSLRA